MNKPELIALVAKKAGITKKDAGEALEAVINSITETLLSGDKVKLIGFGTFKVRNRLARQGLNPQTQEPIVIPAAKVPVFKAGEAFVATMSK